MTIPKTYKHNFLLSELQGLKYSWACYIQDDDNMQRWLSWVNFPKKYRKEINGVVVWIYCGEPVAMWCCESNHPWMLDTIYHPLPYYRLTSWPKKFLSYAWQETNEEYQKEKKDETDLEL